MRINNNVMAMNAHRMYGINSNNVSKSIEKLSSGYRINRAGDDAAGLAISEKMRAQIRGLQMASKNSLDAISLVQVAEGALQTTHDVLQRMREIAVQSASDTNEQEIDRNALQLEFHQLMLEIDDTARKADFNTQKIIDGTWQDTDFVVQTGANQGDTMSIKISAMNAVALGLLRDASGEIIDTSGFANAAAFEDYLLENIIEKDGLVAPDDDPRAFDGVGSGGFVENAVNVATRQNASNSISAVTIAINMVSTMRARLGALQNRLEFKIMNLDITAENLQAAESRIRDVDMAKQMTDFTKQNILSQASTAMLAQANSLPQGVLQLLG